MNKAMIETRPTSMKPEPDREQGRHSISLRIDPAVRQLIDEAAALQGKTRTEFMIECARRQAIDVLLDQQFFELEDAQYQAFVDVLDAPPAPNDRLKALMQRKPAWHR